MSTGVKISVATLCALAIAFLVDYSISHSKANTAHAEVEREVKELPIPAGSGNIAFYSFAKLHGGAATRHLRAPITADQLATYYEQTLSTLNWAFLDNETRQGEKRLLFCRDHHTAVVVLPAGPSSIGTEFSVTVGWGGAYDC
jgi:hypothetical protein